MTVMHTIEPDGQFDEANVGMLAAVGISAVQERVYVHMLDGRDVTVQAVCRSLGLSKENCEQVVADLVSKGLLAPETGPGRRFRAVTPDVAIEALVAHQHDELARARVAASELQDRARQAAVKRDVTPGETLEAVSGPFVAAQRLWQFQVTAEHHVLSIGLPLGCHIPEGDQEPAEHTCLRRGVSHRALIGRQDLADRAAVDAVRAYVAAGGEARVAEAPVRMLLVDDHAAVLPQFSGGEPASAVVVRSAGVVSVLAALGELAWAHAAPLTFTADGVLQPPNGVGTGIENLVPMLVAGCKDETIARQLGVSTRTLDRRIRVLMDNLGAVTRFQAGWLAARTSREATDSG